MAELRDEVVGMRYDAHLSAKENTERGDITPTAPCFAREDAAEYFEDTTAHPYKEIGERD